MTCTTPPGASTTASGSLWAQHLEAIVIGAGAAGLWAAAELRRRGVEGVVLERTGTVAASWRGRYDGLRLNTVRWLSGLPRSPIPRSAGRWPARDDFIAYLEAFARRKRVRISFHTDVSRIERARDRWLVKTSAGGLSARFVVVATGYDRVSKIPEWPGRDDFEGELLHAQEYRNPERFRGKDVLVVGVGNSGTEIAAQLAAGNAARVRVSMRTPVNFVPCEFAGVPMTLLARLGERLPDWLGDRLGFLMQRAAFGDLASYGMPRAPYGIATELRLKGLGPVMERGFVTALKQRRISLVEAVGRFDETDVVLVDGTRISPEVVIAATGYRHGLEALVGHLGVLLPSGKPAVLGANTHPDAPRLYFNGFWLPASGQLPAMRRTSRWIAGTVARERRQVRVRRRRGRSTKAPGKPSWANDNAHPAMALRRDR
jgi:putative flavoprotein involved in K+ transport